MHNNHSKSILYIRFILGVVLPMGFYDMHHLIIISIITALNIVTSLPSHTSANNHSFAFSGMS